MDTLWSIWISTQESLPGFLESTSCMLATDIPPRALGSWYPAMLPQGTGMRWPCGHTMVHMDVHPGSLPGFLESTSCMLTMDIPPSALGSWYPAYAPTAHLPMDNVFQPTCPPPLPAFPSSSYPTYNALSWPYHPAIGSRYPASPHPSVGFKRQAVLLYHYCLAVPQYKIAYSLWPSASLPTAGFTHPAVSFTVL